MKKIIIPFMLAFTSSMANAEHLIKIPLEQVQGGHLPNNSIVFVGSTEVVPETPVNGGSTEVAPETPVKHEPVDCLTNPTDNPQLCEERLTAWEKFASDNNLDNDYNWNHIDWRSKALSYIPDEPYPITSVSIIYLQENQLKKVDGLINLTSARALYLFSNQLTNVNSLRNLTSVELSLYLNENQLKNVDGLINLTSVNTLDLQKNQLENVDGLINLTSVDGLSLIDNQLENVNGLANVKVTSWIGVDPTYSGPKLAANTRFCTQNPVGVFIRYGAQKSQLCQ